MKENDLQYFKIIGKIHNKIVASKNFDEAVMESLKIILRNDLKNKKYIKKSNKIKLIDNNFNYYKIKCKTPSAIKFDFLLLFYQRT